MPSSLALGGRLGSFSSSSSSTSSCPSGRELHVPCDCEEESGGEAEGAAAGRLDSVSEHSDLTEDLWVLPPLPLLLTPLLLPLLLLSAEAPLSSLSSLSPFMSGISFSPGTSTAAAHGWRSSSVAGCTNSRSCVISPRAARQFRSTWASALLGLVHHCRNIHRFFTPKIRRIAPIIRFARLPNFLRPSLSSFSFFGAQCTSFHLGVSPSSVSRCFLPSSSPFLSHFHPAAGNRATDDGGGSERAFPRFARASNKLRKRQLQKYCVNSIYFVYQRKSMECIH